MSVQLMSHQLSPFSVHSFVRVNTIRRKEYIIFELIIKVCNDVKVVMVTGETIHGAPIFAIDQRIPFCNILRFQFQKEGIALTVTCHNLLLAFPHAEHGIYHQPQWEYIYDAILIEWLNGHGRKYYQSIRSVRSHIRQKRFYPIAKAIGYRSVFYSIFAATATTKEMLHGVRRHEFLQIIHSKEDHDDIHRATFLSIALFLHNVHAK
mmetsp:Transcript_22514/g.40036  ORF Transcript_22514/g.40036 Transcript_22514/m.40036 type:complete len:207 (-) Transcript_22514:853-1473(-)